MTKRAYLPVDTGQKPIPIMQLSTPQSIDGTNIHAESNAINGYVVRIVASTGPIRFLVGAAVVALTTSHYLADQQEIYLPCLPTDIVSVLGGVASISTCGVDV